MDFVIVNTVPMNTLTTVTMTKLKELVGSLNYILTSKDM